MKRIVTALLLILCIGIIGAADLESYEFIDRLLSLSGPAAPFIFEDAVVFTAASSWRRVGISFAHEGFSTVHWFRKLLVPKDASEIAAEVEAGTKRPEPNRDSGILFHVQTIPDDLADMDYRMVIDGLWTADPVNPAGTVNSAGIAQSRVSLPAAPRPPATVIAEPPGLRFSFTAPPGEIITVGGNFNNWDPFMYEMRETRRGFYTLTLPLPPGTYQYVFFYRGERLPDPNNPDKVYTRDGKPASQAIISAPTESR